MRLSWKMTLFSNVSSVSYPLVSAVYQTVLGEEEAPRELSSREQTHTPRRALGTAPVASGKVETKGGWR